MTTTKIASAPAGLRWMTSYTCDFFVYELTAEQLAKAKTVYRQSRKAGGGVGISRLLSILAANRPGPALKPVRWVTNRPAGTHMFGKWQR